VAGVVVGEVERHGAVADDEELKEAEEGAGVAVAGGRSCTRRPAPWHGAG
jgi:hypothetical protein